MQTATLDDKPVLERSCGCGSHTLELRFPGKLFHILHERMSSFMQKTNDNDKHALPGDDLIRGGIKPNSNVSFMLLSSARKGGRGEARRV